MFNRAKFIENYRSGQYKLKANCFQPVLGTVTLYQTRIVETKDGYVRLYTGGYRTSTTKATMNAVLDAMGIEAYVFQKKGEWFVVQGGNTLPFIEGFHVQ